MCCFTLILGYDLCALLKTLLWLKCGIALEVLFRYFVLCLQRLTKSLWPHDLVKIWSIRYLILKKYISLSLPHLMGAFDFKGYGLWFLTSLSTIFQLYCGGQFNWRMKPGENHLPVTSHWQTFEFDNFCEIFI